MKTARADRKRLVILAGAAGALIVVLVVRFVLPEGGILEASASGSVARSEAVGVLDSDPGHLSAVAKVARARGRTAYTMGDLRDPMVPLASGGSAPDGRGQDDASSSPQPTYDAGLPAMSLYGIIWDPENPIAMIDGMDLRVGDRIKGAHITEIGFDRVVLLYRSREFTLTVE